MKYKVDLHTHSILSKDGAITEEQYTTILSDGLLDYIAVTDHNEISFAVSLKKKLGEKIIVGEEIRTTQGEVIGLFLKERVPAGLSFAEAIQSIHEQAGLVYVPHPFCHGRSGISQADINQYMDRIDIIEHFNPRNINRQDNVTAQVFGEMFDKPMAASSDAHCVKEIGHTYSIVDEAVSKESLVRSLKKASYITKYTPLWHLLCPKKNRLKKKLGFKVQ